MIIFYYRANESSYYVWTSYWLNSRDKEHICVAKYIQCTIAQMEAIKATANMLSIEILVSKIAP